MKRWVLLLFLAACAGGSEERGEVRQLVYFHFLPGRMNDAVQVFRDEALPLYRQNEPMLRFRAYRESESPVPLDLVVVSTFEGMSGMDASNRALGEQARKRGTSVGGIYGRISALSSQHRDEFVEIQSALSWGSVDEANLVALVSIRLAPGAVEGYETMVRNDVLPWERGLDVVSGSETGRFLLADGFTFFRTIGLADLGAWHEYVREERRQPFRRALDELVVESRQILVAPLRELAVR
jgi:hypothetical protein